MPDVKASDISLRFKHGIHTIFLFVNIIATRAAVSTQLLHVLRARHPDGLVASTDPGAAVAPIPPPLGGDGDDECEEDRVEFAVLNDSKAPDQGWRKVDAAPGEVLARKGLIEDGAVLAFRFVGAEGKRKGRGEEEEEEEEEEEDEEGDDEWVVQWAQPIEEEEEYE